MRRRAYIPTNERAAVTTTEQPTSLSEPPSHLLFLMGLVAVSIVQRSRRKVRPRNELTGLGSSVSNRPLTAAEAALLF
jgi:hypothetical protein